MSVLMRLSRTSARPVISQCRNSSGTNRESPLKGLLNDAADFKDGQNEWATRPYPHIPSMINTIDKNLVTREASIIMFPGQGTHYLGMGKELFKYPNVQELYQCASEVVGCNLMNITTEEELNKYSQVSIVAASLAAVERLRDERQSAISSCVGAAGFSLGEITALIFAGAIPVDEGFKLVNIRTLAMDAASKERPGGLINVLYSAGTNIREAMKDAVEYGVQCKEKHSFCSIANYLFPHCVVIAGSEKALKYFEENKKKHELVRVKRINVTGPFHSDAMQSAVEPMRQALKLCSLQDPIIPVYSASNNKAYRTPRDIISRLPKQIASPLKWEQLLHFFYARPKGSAFPRTFEVGPGNTLRTILRKVNGPAWDNSYSIPA